MRMLREPSRPTDPSGSPDLVRADQQPPTSSSAESCQSEVSVNIRLRLPTPRIAVMMTRPILHCACDGVLIEANRVIGLRCSPIAHSLRAPQPETRLGQTPH